MTSRAIAAVASLGKDAGLAVLGQVGAVFAAATELEKYLSGPFVAIPFPCFPALRCWDSEMGFPHAHGHPPNLIPPAPPVPLPSTGPVLKIPFMSGADETFINSINASCCGDMGLGIWCGGFFPLFEVKFGSASVWIEGSRAARQLVDTTIHCSPSKPTGKDLPIGGGIGMTMMGSPDVMIGGVPMPSLMDLGFAGIFKVLGAAMKGLKKVAKLLGKTKAGKAFNAARKSAGDWVRKVFKVKKGSRVSKAICFFSGHPVNVANGSVLAFAEDFELPGQLPLQWGRDWYSTSEREGLLGHGWHHPYDFALVVDVGADDSVCPPQDIIGMRLADGRVLIFPEFDKHGEAYERTERLTLFRDARGYGVRTAEHLTYRFGDGPTVDQEVRELSSVEDPSGARISFLRNARNHLTRIIDSAGRILKVETDRRGRITRIVAPNPLREGEWQQMVAYRYSEDADGVDGSGDLVEVQDALGQRQRYRYEDHLLQEETDRNGLGFYFEYHGQGVSACCTRTWGDGHLYDHHMVYTAEKTQVTNSLGEVSFYYLDANGLVTSQQDPCGGVTHYEYNAHNQETAQMDPLGRATASVFDARGNLIEATTADGTTVTLVYSEQDDLVSAVDAIGGTWAWAYDDQHRLVERKDPTGATTRYEYRSRYLGALVDAAGRRTRFDYDAYGNLTLVTLPDGTTTQWEVDALGRPTSVTRIAVDDCVDGGGAHEAPDTLTPMAGVLLAHPPTGPPGGGDDSSVEGVDVARDGAARGAGRGDVAGAVVDGAVAEDVEYVRPEGVPAGLITWLFEPESFAPLAKIVGTERQSIVCDHLGTPVAMYDAQGTRVWAAELSGYGDVRGVDVGARGDCPFRYPGQYEDVETGLYYNRFRYYDPEAGTYVSQDPIGLAGGAALYGYVGDPTGWVDPFGLENKCGDFTGDSLEDAVAKRLRDAGIPFESGKKFGPNGSLGEIDFETADAIIEVTSKQKGKLAQVNKLRTNSTMNQARKPVILFAPDYRGNAARDVNEAGGIVVNTGSTIYEDLDQLVALLG